MPAGAERLPVLNPLQWEALGDEVRSGECTPFIGAGACVPILPTGAELARSLAAQYEYPLADRDDLARVVQFATFRAHNAVFPKRQIVNRIKARGYPDFSGDEPHHVLALLKLPVYLTTNYDDFMTKALEQNQRKPCREYCRWNRDLAKKPGIWQKEPAYKPNPEVPVVYHLHGCDMAPESIVATEDDYLEFMYNIPKSGSSTKTVGKGWKMFPPPIRNAISNHSLIFLGYRLGDWNFRIIFRWLVLELGATQQRTKIAVQLSPTPDRQFTTEDIWRMVYPPKETSGAGYPELTAEKCLELIGLLEKQKLDLDSTIAELRHIHARLSGKISPYEDAVTYHREYFYDMFKVSIFWGTAREFAAKLREYA